MEPEGANHAEGALLRAARRRAEPAPRWLGAAIFFTIFAAYMGATSRERPWGDANPVYEVAESLVGHGGVDVTKRWPADAPAGRNGKYYAANPLLTSLVHVPGELVRRAAARIWPAADGLALALACHLAPSALGALACLLFFGLCRHHGASVPLASGGTLVLAFATPVWVYARYPYTEIVQIACFTGYFLALLRALDDPSPKTARALGLWAGLLVNAKLVYCVTLPGAAALLAWSLRRDGRRLLSFFLWSGLAFVPAAALILFYDWLRWGSVFKTGYNALGPVIQRGSIPRGLWGMFFSSGKSIFLYAPPLVLSLWGARAAARRYPRTMLALAVTVAPAVLVNARFPFWSGDFAWGPRYLMFAVPVLLLPGFLFFKDAIGSSKLGLALPAGLLVGAGIFVQLMGSAFYWDHFIRLSMEVRSAWLGKPNLSGAVTPDVNGNCGACFEDMYPLLWLPPFQPIGGHWWAVRHVVRGDDWKKAADDAPWRKETSMKIAVPADVWNRFRVDWWGLDYQRRERAAALLLALMALLGGGSALLWWRGASRWDEPR